MLPRIFVGGTGRSGTSILYRALGCHESVFSLPMEMRFLIDPDGLVALVDALTVRYSPVQAREALFRFERLMRVDLNTPEHPPFLSYSIANWLGDEYYWQCLDKFCAQLVELEYEASSSPLSRNMNGRLAPVGLRLKQFGQRLLKEPNIPHRTTFNWPRQEVKVVKYFGDRSELLKLATDFVDDLFLHAAHESGKQTWCEKTPQNIFHIDFLRELFPNSVFIHMKRDPRGVAQSVIKQDWGPNDLEGACIFLQEMYDSWFSFKSRLNIDDRQYLELKLEALAAEPDSTLARVASFCGLENRYRDLPEIKVDKVNYWQHTMTAQERQLANQLLGPYIEQMGYEV